MEANYTTQQCIKVLACKDQTTISKRLLERRIRRSHQSEIDLAITKFNPGYSFQINLDNILENSCGAIYGRFSKHCGENLVGYFGWDADELLRFLNWNVFYSEFRIKRKRPRVLPKESSIAKHFGMENLNLQHQEEFRKFFVERNKELVAIYQYYHLRNSDYRDKATERYLPAVYKQIFFRAGYRAKKGKPYELPADDEGLEWLAKTVLRFQMEQIAYDLHLGQYVYMAPVLAYIGRYRFGNIWEDRLKPFVLARNQVTLVQVPEADSENFASRIEGQESLSMIRALIFNDLPPTQKSAMIDTMKGLRFSDVKDLTGNENLTENAYNRRKSVARARLREILRRGGIDPKDLLQ